MCGIAGIVGSRANKEHVERMCSTIFHRGPDSNGFYIRSGVALGMQRLSIIDLVTGDQPIHNEDKTIWTICNGEIYNFRSVRDDLESRGHRFYTSGDTELLVHAYEEFAGRLCSVLRGMYAFALWDEQQEKLFLARDRLGKKPLYYTLLGDSILFASEIKALLCLPDVSPEIDPVSLDQFLTLGYVPGPRTMFRGVKKLLPGHQMEFCRGSVSLRQYWDITSQAADVPQTDREEEWLEWLDERLDESVKLRLVSDVPLGAFLSGGVDSSTVVALMRRHIAGPLKTFSVGFDVKAGYDELEHARLTARHFETEHHELVMESSPTDLLESVVWHLDEPIADEASVPTFLVSRLARQHVKVVLTGEGADELFAGYGQYYYVKTLNEMRARFPEALVRSARALLSTIPEAGRSGVWLERGRKVLLGLLYPPERSFIHYGQLTTAHLREQIYSSELKNQLLLDPDSQDDPRLPFFEKTAGLDALSQALYVDTKLWLPDELLMKVDKMTMANSLEARAPYLDHPLVEGVFKMPACLKIHRRTGKYLLRRLARSFLPGSISERRKHAFSVPYDHWFNGALRGLVQDTLRPERVRAHGLLDPAAIQQRVRSYFQHGQQGPKETRALWALLCFHMWHELFFTHVDETPPRYRRHECLEARPTSVHDHAVR